MPNSDAFGYKIFEGGVVRKTCFSYISGIFRKVEKPAAGLKKVPGYIKLGRSGRHVPWRPCEEEFREKIARDKKVARWSKIFRLNPAFEGRSEAFALGPRLI